ncbi:hypothetical protein GMRT_15879 [Giardia muris]|uniref:Uncharacterized protein n=1 Tax=Giardia muris TaxID=5742 RepID=A0A4Z1T9S8_GIAMU|nr:hypothetical protein GMRT_15879 [Giardia muris]|eukprot:TNJ29927.1 hypothetical protein GMRT_15879 [Giardia muris]
MTTTATILCDVRERIMWIQGFIQNGRPPGPPYVSVREAYYALDRRVLQLLASIPVAQLFSFIFQQWSGVWAETGKELKGDVTSNRFQGASFFEDSRKDVPGVLPDPQGYFYSLLWEKAYEMYSAEARAFIRESDGDGTSFGVFAAFAYNSRVHPVIRQRMAILLRLYITLDADSRENPNTPQGSPTSPDSMQTGHKVTRDFFTQLSYHLSTRAGRKVDREFVLIPFFEVLHLYPHRLISILCQNHVLEKCVTVCLRATICTALARTLAYASHKKDHITAKKVVGYVNSRLGTLRAIEMRTPYAVFGLFAEMCCYSEEFRRSTDCKGLFTRWRSDTPVQLRLIYLVRIITHLHFNVDMFYDDLQEYIDGIDSYATQHINLFHQCDNESGQYGNLDPRHGWLLCEFLDGWKSLSFQSANNRVDDCKPLCDCIFYSDEDPHLYFSDIDLAYLDSSDSRLPVSFPSASKQREWVSIHRQYPYMNARYIRNTYFFTIPKAFGKKETAWKFSRECLNYIRYLFSLLPRRFSTYLLCKELQVGDSYVYIMRDLFPSLADETASRDTPESDTGKTALRARLEEAREKVKRTVGMIGLYINNQAHNPKAGYKPPEGIEMERIYLLMMITVSCYYKCERSSPQYFHPPYIDEDLYFLLRAYLASPQNINVTLFYYARRCFNLRTLEEIILPGLTGYHGYFRRSVQVPIEGVHDEHPLVPMTAHLLSDNFDYRVSDTVCRRTLSTRYVIVDKMRVPTNLALARATALATRREGVSTLDIGGNTVEVNSHDPTEGNERRSLMGNYGMRAVPRLFFEKDNLLNDTWTLDTNEHERVNMSILHKTNNYYYIAHPVFIDCIDYLFRFEDFQESWLNLLYQNSADSDAEFLKEIAARCKPIKSQEDMARKVTLLIDAVLVILKTMRSAYPIYLNELRENEHESYASTIKKQDESLIDNVISHTRIYSQSSLIDDIPQVASTSSPASQASEFLISKGWHPSGDTESGTEPDEAYPPNPLDEYLDEGETALQRSTVNIPTVMYTHVVDTSLSLNRSSRLLQLYDLYLSCTAAYPDAAIPMSHVAGACELFIPAKYTIHFLHSNIKLQALLFSLQLLLDRTLPALCENEYVLRSLGLLEGALFGFCLCVPYQSPLILSFLSYIERFMARLSLPERLTRNLIVDLDKGVELVKDSEENEEADETGQNRYHYQPIYQYITAFSNESMELMHTVLAQRRSPHLHDTRDQRKEDDRRMRIQEIITSITSGGANTNSMHYFILNLLKKMHSPTFLTCFPGQTHGLFLSLVDQIEVIASHTTLERIQLANALSLEYTLLHTLYYPQELLRLYARFAPEDLHTLLQYHVGAVDSISHTNIVSVYFFKTAQNKAAQRASYLLPWLSTLFSQTPLCVLYSLGRVKCVLDTISRHRGGGEFTVRTVESLEMTYDRVVLDQYMDTETNIPGYVTDATGCLTLANYRIQHAPALNDTSSATSVHVSMPTPSGQVARRLGISPYAHSFEETSTPTVTEPSLEYRNSLLYELDLKRFCDTVYDEIITAYLDSKSIGNEARTALAYLPAPPRPPAPNIRDQMNPSTIGADPTDASIRSSFGHNNASTISGSDWNPFLNKNLIITAAFALQGGADWTFTLTTDEIIRRAIVRGYAIPAKFGLSDKLEEHGFYLENDGAPGLSMVTPAYQSDKLTVGKIQMCKPFVIARQGQRRFRMLGSVLPENMFRSLSPTSSGSLQLSQSVDAENEPFETHAAGLLTNFLFYLKCMGTPAIFYLVMAAHLAQNCTDEELQHHELEISLLICIDQILNIWSDLLLFLPHFDFLMNAVFPWNDEVRQVNTSLLRDLLELEIAATNNDASVHDLAAILNAARKTPSKPTLFAAVRQAFGTTLLNGIPSEKIALTLLQGKPFTYVAFKRRALVVLTYFSQPDFLLLMQKLYDRVSRLVVSTRDRLWTHAYLYQHIMELCVKVKMVLFRLSQARACANYLHDYLRHPIVVQQFSRLSIMQTRILRNGAKEYEARLRMVLASAPNTPEDSDLQTRIALARERVNYVSCAPRLAVVSGGLLSDIFFSFNLFEFMRHHDRNPSGLSDLQLHEVDSVIDEPIGEANTPITNSDNHSVVYEESQQEVVEESYLSFGTQNSDRDFVAQCITHLPAIYRLSADKRVENFIHNIEETIRNVYMDFNRGALPTGPLGFPVINSNGQPTGERISVCCKHQDYSSFGIWLSNLIQIISDFFSGLRTFDSVIYLVSILTSRLDRASGEVVFLHSDGFLNIGTETAALEAVHFSNLRYFMAHYSASTNEAWDLVWVQSCDDIDTPSASETSDRSRARTRASSFAQSDSRLPSNLAMYSNVYQPALLEESISLERSVAQPRPQLESSGPRIAALAEQMTSVLILLGLLNVIGKDAFAALNEPQVILKTTVDELLSLVPMNTVQPSQAVRSLDDQTFDNARTVPLSQPDITRQKSRSTFFERTTPASDEKRARLRHGSLMGLTDTELGIGSVRLTAPAPQISATVIHRKRGNTESGMDFDNVYASGLTGSMSDISHNEDERPSTPPTASTTCFFDDLALFQKLFSQLISITEYRRLEARALNNYALMSCIDGFTRNTMVACPSVCALLALVTLLLQSKSLFYKDIGEKLAILLTRGHSNSLTPQWADLLSMAPEALLPRRSQMMSILDTSFEENNLSEALVERYKGVLTNFCEHLSQRCAFIAPELLRVSEKFSGTLTKTSSDSFLFPMRYICGQFTQRYFYMRLENVYEEEGNYLAMICNRPVTSELAYIASAPAQLLMQHAAPLGSHLSMSTLEGPPAGLQYQAGVGIIPHRNYALSAAFLTNFLKFSNQIQSVVQTFSSFVEGSYVSAIIGKLVVLLSRNILSGNNNVGTPWSHLTAVRQHIERTLRSDPALLVVDSIPRPDLLTPLIDSLLMYACPFATLQRRHSIFTLNTLQRQTSERELNTRTKSPSTGQPSNTSPSELSIVGEDLKLMSGYHATSHFQPLQSIVHFRQGLQHFSAGNTTEFYVIGRQDDVARCSSQLERESTDGSLTSNQIIYNIIKEMTRRSAAKIFGKIRRFVSIYSEGYLSLRGELYQSPLLFSTFPLQFSLAHIAKKLLANALHIEFEDAKDFCRRQDICTQEDGIITWKITGVDYHSLSDSMHRSRASRHSQDSNMGSDETSKEAHYLDSMIESLVFLFTSPYMKDLQPDGACFVVLQKDEVRDLLPHEPLGGHLLPQRTGSFTESFVTSSVAPDIRSRHIISRPLSPTQSTLLPEGHIDSCSLTTTVTTSMVHMRSTSGPLTNGSVVHNPSTDLRALRFGEPPVTPSDSLSCTSSSMHVEEVLPTPTSARNTAIFTSHPATPRYSGQVEAATPLVYQSVELSRADSQTALQSLIGSLTHELGRHQDGDVQEYVRRMLSQQIHERPCEFDLMSLSVYDAPRSEFRRYYKYIFNTDTEVSTELLTNFYRALGTRYLDDHFLPRVLCFSVIVALDSSVTMPTVEAGAPWLLPTRRVINGTTQVAQMNDFITSTSSTQGPQRGLDGIAIMYDPPAIEPPRLVSFNCFNLKSLQIRCDILEHTILPAARAQLFTTAYFMGRFRVMINDIGRARRHSLCTAHRLSDPDDAAISKALNVAEEPSSHTVIPEYPMTTTAWSELTDEQTALFQQHAQHLMDLLATSTMVLDHLHCLAMNAAIVQGNYCSEISFRILDQVRSALLHETLILIYIYFECRVLVESPQLLPRWNAHSARLKSTLAKVIASQLLSSVPLLHYNGLSILNAFLGLTTVYGSKTEFYHSVLKRVLKYICRIGGDQGETASQSNEDTYSTYIFHLLACSLAMALAHIMTQPVLYRKLYQSMRVPHLDINPVLKRPDQLQALAGQYRAILNEKDRILGELGRPIDTFAILNKARVSVASASPTVASVREYTTSLAGQIASDSIKNVYYYNGEYTHIIEMHACVSLFLQIELESSEYNLLPVRAEGINVLLHPYLTIWAEVLPTRRGRLIRNILLAVELLRLTFVRARGLHSTQVLFQNDISHFQRSPFEDIVWRLIWADLLDDEFEAFPNNDLPTAERLVWLALTYRDVEAEPPVVLIEDCDTEAPPTMKVEDTDVDQIVFLLLILCYSGRVYEIPAALILLEFSRRVRIRGIPAFFQRLQAYGKGIPYAVKNRGWDETPQQLLPVTIAILDHCFSGRSGLPDNIFLLPNFGTTSQILHYCFELPRAVFSRYALIDL